MTVLARRCGRVDERPHTVLVQRLRLAEVDNVERVPLSGMRVAHRKEIPLCVAACAVVPVEQQVVLVTVDVHCAAQIAALEAALEKQRTPWHPISRSRHKDHRVVDNTVEHLPGICELAPPFYRRVDQYLALAATLS